MSSNTREYLTVARMEIDAALEEERRHGGSEALIRHIAKAAQDLAHAKEIQRSILSGRRLRPILLPKVDVGEFPPAARLTTDRTDPRLGHGVDEQPIGGQHSVYLVLSDDERAKGFVRPYVENYVHARELGGCGSVTHMGRALSETYAAKPTFYGATYCVHCDMHKRVGEDGEFFWSDKIGYPLQRDGKPWKVGT